MVKVVDPETRETVHDPACGTGGFLLAAWEDMRKKPVGAQCRSLYRYAPGVFGIDIVPEVVRLCAMNLYLHDIAGRDSPRPTRSPPRSSRTCKRRSTASVRSRLACKWADGQKRVWSWSVSARSGRAPERPAKVNP
jgi:hypothetical protein